ncbi:hypothetical protein F511_27821 [Dorcoceras hygrometricum]|uniref:Alpha-ketoglutarate-dependent dioxygenase AlkB-like domain-containing protein n=1 Tax=Dorcoceras hygrometricum TaxID=472368 RepID=A0A2Z7C1T7_9LAMI|nr:hypothetical protein F511_27821 [Dorcoceras hygrometricum]
MAIEEFVVDSVPTVFYVPDYVSEAEEEQLLKNIYNAPISKWKTLKNRRLQNWGGVVHDKGLLAQCFPPWLEQVTHRICTESRLFPSAINHVLINEYLPDQGIMPHQDGPAYVPVVAILSLGSPVIMNFTPHPSVKDAGGTTDSNNNTVSEPEPMYMSNGVFGEHRPFSVALMPRSLLIFKDAAYLDYMHGIEDSELQRYDVAINVKNGLLVNGQIPAITNLEIVSGNSENGGSTNIRRTVVSTARSQSSREFSARALDSVLQEYAFKSFVRPRTGIVYDRKLPANFTGIGVAALRLRSGSLRRRGVRVFKEFGIPIGIFEQPYCERLVLVYHNLGNWSSVYYPLPGYTLLAPVLGLLAYDANDLSASSLSELDIRASEDPISINFPNVQSRADGSSPMCVNFGLDGSVGFDNFHLLTSHFVKLHSV